jgi:hypothetical protein
MNDYWVGRVVDELEISDRVEAQRILSTEAGFKRAVEIAMESRLNVVHPIPGNTDKSRAIAGRHLDLSGIDSCIGVNCLIREADEGLTQIWQLFDVAVVEGLSPLRFLEDVESSDPETENILKSQIEVYLHLRSHDTLSNVEFVAKPIAEPGTCVVCHVERAHLPDSVNEGSIHELIEILKNEGEYSVEDDGDGGSVVQFGHPTLVSPSWTFFGPGEQVPTKDQCAIETVQAACLSMVSDVDQSRELGAPLVADMDQSFRLFESTRVVKSTTTDDVSVNIQIPMLLGLKSYELLRLRTEFPDEFVLFRSATIDAIKARLAHDVDADPRKVAEEVTREVLEPAVARMNRSLATSMRSFLQMAGLQAAVGGVLTAVGLLDHLPLLFGGSALGVGGFTIAPSGTVPTLLQNRRDVSLDNLYFLHRAQRILQGHAS